MAEPVLTIHGVTKHFRGGEGVDRIVGLRSNAARSTRSAARTVPASRQRLMNIIAGVLRPTGRNPRRWPAGYVSALPPSPIARHRPGYRNRALPGCDGRRKRVVAAGNRRRSPFMNYRALERDAETVMNRLAAIDVRRKVADLPISPTPASSSRSPARFGRLDCRVLILDEPTAALTETEAQQLFSIIRGLKANGISIIYISHRMAGIFQRLLRPRDRVPRRPLLMPYGYVQISRPTTWCAAWSAARSRSSIPTSSVPMKPLVETVLRLTASATARVSKTSASAYEKAKFSVSGGLIGSGRTEIAEGICDASSLHVGRGAPTWQGSRRFRPMR